MEIVHLLAKSLNFTSLARDLVLYILHDLVQILLHFSLLCCITRLSLNDSLKHLLETLGKHGLCLTNLTLCCALKSGQVTLPAHVLILVVISWLYDQEQVTSRLHTTTQLERVVIDIVQDSAILSP